MSRKPEPGAFEIATNNRTENLAAHRAHILGATLPAAVAYGVAEVEPTREPLRVCLSF
jgi:hypothetical protein